MRPMKAVDQSMNYRMSGEITLRPDRSYFVEPKIDGVRTNIEYDDEGRPTVTIATSGNLVKHDLNVPTVPSLANTVLDGELTIPGETLGTLVGALNASRRRPTLDRAVFYAFDALRVAGGDARGVPLGERLSLLKAILTRTNKDVAVVLPVSRIEVKGSNPDKVVRFAQRCKKAGFEGVMVKDAESIYVDGRSKSWIKVKWLSTLDCFVTGWEPGDGGYTNMVGSLQMSVYEDGEPVEVCSHGVFDLAFRRALTAEDGSLDDQWYGQVMEIAYQSAGTDRRLRHPRLLRLRPDRTPESCTIDQLAET